eukprot:1161774-Pelagomonas_calceolata.AAC.3
MSSRLSESGVHAVDDGHVVLNLDYKYSGSATATAVSVKASVQMRESSSLGLMLLMINGGAHLVPPFINASCLMRLVAYSVSHIWNAVPDQQAFLTEQGAPGDLVERVLSIIESVGFKDELGKQAGHTLSPEQACVQDADRQEQCRQTGVMQARTMQTGVTSDADRCDAGKNDADGCDFRCRRASVMQTGVPADADRNCLSSYVVVLEAHKLILSLAGSCANQASGFFSNGPVNCGALSVCKRDSLADAMNKATSVFDLQQGSWAARLAEMEDMLTTGFRTAESADLFKSSSALNSSSLADAMTGRVIVALLLPYACIASTCCVGYISQAGCHRRDWHCTLLYVWGFECWQHLDYKSIHPSAKEKVTGHSQHVCCDQQRSRHCSMHVRIACMDVCCGQQEAGIAACIEGKDAAACMYVFHVCKDLHILSGKEEDAAASKKEALQV